MSDARDLLPLLIALEFCRLAGPHRSICAGRFGISAKRRGETIRHRWKISA
jgi:hypothetical protein